MQFPSSSTNMVTVKQSYIDDLQKKAQQHLEFCKSVERCFEKNTKELRFKIKDQNYQITTMKEQLSRYRKEKELKDQEIEEKKKKNEKQKQENEKQKQIVEKQKQEIVDLNVAFQHLFGDDSFQKNDCDIETNVKQDVVEEDSDEDIDLNPSNKSSNQH